MKAGFAKFTLPVYGGFDGFDITEKEPFRNSKFSSSDETTSYEIASLKRAVDAVSDPEVVEMNALALPGITNTRVTNHAIRTCEDRADALAVIDIENGGYIPSTENKDNFKTRVQNSKVRNAVDSIENRGLDTSYACAFYPWVKIADQLMIDRCGYHLQLLHSVLSVVRKQDLSYGLHLQDSQEVDCLMEQVVCLYFQYLREFHREKEMNFTRQILIQSLSSQQKVLLSLVRRPCRQLHQRLIELTYVA